MSRQLSLPAIRALADLAQMIEGVDSGLMAVAPVDADSVTADRLNRIHFQGRLKHLERIRRIGQLRLVHLRFRSMSAGTRGAGTLLAQIDKSEFTMMPIRPIDLNTF